MAVWRDNKMAPVSPGTGWHFQRLSLGLGKYLQKMNQKRAFCVASEIISGLKPSQGNMPLNWKARTFCKIIQKVCWTLNLSWWLLPSELHSLKVAMIPAPCQTSFLETLANCWPLERLVTLIAVFKKKKALGTLASGSEKSFVLAPAAEFFQASFWGWLELFLSVSSYTGGYSVGLFPPNFSACQSPGGQQGCQGQSP